MVNFLGIYFKLENSGSNFTASSNRLNYSSKSKIDNILRDLANDSSSDDDAGGINSKSQSLNV